MKFSYRFPLVCLSFLFFSLNGSSQISSLSVKDLSTIHIRDISDEEIKAYLQKASANGISEQNMYRLLIEKGLPQNEINELEKRLEKLDIKTSDKNGGSQYNEPDDVNANSKRTYFSSNSNGANGVNSNINKGDTSIFGSELFTTSSLVFEPNLRIATPSGYVLGPDDELTVIVFGLSEKSYNLTVNAEGFIYIQNVGPLYVSGLTIEQAGEKIKLKLGATIYRAMQSGQTKVQISLRKIRSIRVIVIGAAKRPGTFTVSSLTTLFNLLYLCGGPTDYGSYRTIELIRGDNVKHISDLYVFLLKGSKNNDILLREGDVIRIPYYKTRVSISGEVKREGKFEMLENETFSDLLSFTGGFSDYAYKASVSVTRLTDREKIIVDLPVDGYSGFKPKGSDSFVIGKLMNRFENRIYITGAVFRPGAYELTTGMSLNDLVKKSGGLKEDAYMKRINIYRKNNDLTPTMVALNLDSVFNGQSDLVLVKNDSAVVYSIFDFREALIVEVKGQVKKPGQFEWRDNLKLIDILLLSGGIADFGDSTRIEISRRIRNANVGQLNFSQTEIFTINLTEINDPLKDIGLQPFDVIIVKTLPGYTRQRAVFVQGEVMSQGLYTLSKSGDRLSEIFNRVGGFKASADSSYAILKRYNQSNLSAEERDKIFQRILSNDSSTSSSGLQNDIYKAYDIISVDLSKALFLPNSRENLRLEDGDVITVQRNSNLVKITGEVYYPTMVPFKSGEGLNYYINLAGGYIDRSSKAKTVIIYPDGKVRSVKKFLLFKSNPTILPRSEIYVPKRIANNRAKISVGELALIVSALGIIANVIIYAGK